MAKPKERGEKMYYFIDIELTSRKVIGWGTDTREEMEVEIGNGCHRLFVSTGQYNKLVRQLEGSRS